MEQVKKHSVALGLGNNVDYEIEWDTSVFETLIRTYSISQSDIRSYETIQSERELICSILYYFINGSGHEVYVQDSEIVETFSDRFHKRVTMGGTCIRAAIAMEHMGKAAAMHLVTMNDDVRAQLPKHCDYVCSNDNDSSYPHLIIQYKADVQICANGLNVCSPQANRIIYTNDVDNMMIRISPEYARLIDTAKIFLVSGFNVITDAALLDDRIDSLLSLLQALPKQALVFYESGCFFREAFIDHVIRRLHNTIDIYSMNEEEMCQMLKRPIDLMDAQAVGEALCELRAYMGIRYVLVHTHLWAAIVGENAKRFETAVVSAVNLATTRYRFGDDYGQAQYESTVQLPIMSETKAFLTALNEKIGACVCAVPVPVVPEKNVTTIGLGDCFVGGFMLPFAADDPSNK